MRFAPPQDLPNGRPRDTVYFSILDPERRSLREISNPDSGETDEIFF
jgi:hypothetical protein